MVNKGSTWRLFYKSAHHTFHTRVMELHCVKDTENSVKNVRAAWPTGRKVGCVSWRQMEGLAQEL